MKPAIQNLREECFSQRKQQSSPWDDKGFVIIKGQEEGQGGWSLLNEGENDRN